MPIARALHDDGPHRMLVGEEARLMTAWGRRQSRGRRRRTGPRWLLPVGQHPVRNRDATGDLLSWV